MRQLAHLAGLGESSLSGLSNESIGWITLALLGIDPKLSILDAIEVELRKIQATPAENRTRFQSIRQESLQLARSSIVLSRSASRFEPPFRHDPNVDFGEEFDEWYLEIQRSKDSREVMAAGKRRSTEYSRTIGLFPPFSMSIYLSDPYASTAIAGSNEKSGRAWLLRKLLSDAPTQPLEIVTALPNSLPYGNFFKELDKAERLIDDFAQLLKKQPARTGSVTLRIVEFNPSVFHARTLGFQFDVGSFGITLDKGLDDYMDDPLPRNLNLQPLSDFQLKSEKANLDSLATIRVQTFG